MKITYSEGKQNKVHISVDGEYMFTVDAEFWYSCPWCRVTEIEDGEKQDEFLNDVGSRYAFISGLRILSYGDNSRKELSVKLMSKGHKSEYVAIALDKLEEYGYINDNRYARYLTDRLIRVKHMSRNGIRSELLRKGISREIAEITLEETEFDAVQDICTLLETRFRKNLGDEKGVKRTVAALQRLGYGWSDIKTAMRECEVNREDDF